MDASYKQEWVKAVNLTTCFTKVLVRILKKKNKLYAVVLSAVAYLRKAPTTVVMSVRLSTRLPLRGTLSIYILRNFIKISR